MQSVKEKRGAAGGRARKGRKQTPEWIEKKAAANRGNKYIRHQEHYPNKSRRGNQKHYDAVLNALSKRGANPSKLERDVAEMFVEESVKLGAQCRIGKYIVDFAFHHLMTVVEIFGCYWHRCEPCEFDQDEIITKRDANKLQFLRSQEWEVIIIWEHELKANPEILLP